MTSYGKIWGSSKKSISLKVSKYYFSKFYGQKSGQKCHYWRKFGQNSSRLVKMVKIGSFWGSK